MVSLELPGESVDLLQTLAFDLRWSSLTTLLKQAIQGTDECLALYHPRMMLLTHRMAQDPAQPGYIILEWV